MRSLAIATAIAFAAPLVSVSAEPALIPVREAIALAAALRSLDSHQQVVNGQVVTLPYEFGSGSLRLRIANNLSMLAGVERAADASRQTIFREVTVKSGVTEIKPATAEYEAFTRQFTEVLDQPAYGTQGLAHIKASELRLDKNEIPVTVLTALKPILDMDVQP